MKTPLAYALIALTIAFTVVGQLLVKYGTRQVGSFPAALDGAPTFLLRALTNPGILLGLASAAIAAIAWIGAVSLTDISFAYPFMGLAIVLVLVLAPLVFGETVSLWRWLGVALVCLGITIAARG
jgi:multidrug transporter EmrE-like cation transporter